MNHPEKGRRNCGAEGPDKSVIDKRQSLRNEQSLTEAREKHIIIRSHCSSRRPVNTHTHTCGHYGRCVQIGCVNKFGEFSTQRYRLGRPIGVAFKIREGQQKLCTSAGIFVNWLDN